MFSTASYQPTSRPSSRASTTPSEGQDQAKKPKKVNSELRKQQNRIASRNYREKRKRKLQYLQQLLRDGDSPEQSPQAVEEPYRRRIMTPEYQDHRELAPSYTIPSNAPVPDLASQNGTLIDPAHEHPHSRTPQIYSTYPWSSPIYDPAPAPEVTWEVPNWTPDLDYASSSSESYQYTPPSHAQTFEQHPVSLQTSRAPGPDLFSLGSYEHVRRYDNQQPSGMTNMHLNASTSSSTYPYVRYGA